MDMPPVKRQEFFLKSSTKNSFYATSYMPSGRPLLGVVQIITGMAEHAGRYHDFAVFLAENGFGVYACDHPGQGKTAGTPDKIGVIASKRGWQIMLENVRSLYNHIRKSQPDAPVFVFGHSMGSVLARHFTALYPIYIQGLVLSGTFMMSSISLTLSINFIRLLIALQGSNKINPWLNTLFYGNFNRHFRDKPTLFEWISSNRSEVDTYVADPYCGFSYTNGFYLHLLKGIAQTKRAESLLTYRKTLPVLIMSGREDPVGKFGKDPDKIHKEYYKQHFQNLSFKLFHGRHELLHETNKEDVYQYLLDWLTKSLDIR